MTEIEVVADRQAASSATDGIPLLKAVFKLHDGSVLRSRSIHRSRASSTDITSISLSSWKLLELFWQGHNQLAAQAMVGRVSHVVNHVLLVAVPDGAGDQPPMSAWRVNAMQSASIRELD